MRSASLVFVLFTSAAAQSWTKKEGVNCYENPFFGGGAVNIDAYPIGPNTIAECQAKCEQTADCTAITYSLGDDGITGNCWRRKDINLGKCATHKSNYDTWLKEDLSVQSESLWAQEKGVNCYSGHGATEIDTNPLKSLSVTACQDKCNKATDCTGITISTDGSCYRRKNINLAKCEADSSKYDTWMKRAAPPAPTPSPVSSKFPTTVPPFIQGVIEGLLSDYGTDAKHCEHDVLGFKDALLALAGTAVGQVDAVAAGVMGAKQTCSVVAADAEKLSLNAVEDLFHPMQIGKHFADTRSDVLNFFGSALEMMAIGDFKGAGDKVGMATRRIISGADTNSLPIVEHNVEADTQANIVASAAVFTVAHWGFAAGSQKDLQGATSANWADFLFGTLEGLMSDGTDLSDCYNSVVGVKDLLDKACAQVGKALAQLETAAGIAKASCGVIKDETEKLMLNGFEDILHPDRFVQNILATQHDFESFLGQGLQDLSTDDYIPAGQFFGMAIRRMFEGAQSSVIV